MLRSPMQDDQHVRHLLDQRSQRADVHARFPSLSERSDSPSIYSHAQFRSPRVDTSSLYYPYPSPASAYPASPVSSTSVLPDARSLQTSYTDDDNDHRDLLDEDDVDPDVEPDSRMSFLGPKMRFHSPAPWEMGEDTVHEEGDSDAASFDTLSIFGGNKRSRNKTVDSDKRSFASTAPRPSLESVFSQGKAKKSFETTGSSQSALHTLAHASMSSTSLALSTSQSTHRLQPKRSMPGLNLRSRTISNSSSASPSPAPPLPSPRSGFFPSSQQSSPTNSYVYTSPTRSEFSTRDPSPSPSPSPTPTSKSSGDYVHPYANPEVVPRDPGRLAAPSASRTLTRSDSTLTVTLPDNTSTPSMRALSPSSATLNPWEFPMPGTGTSKIALISLEEARERVRGASSGGVPMINTVNADRDGHSMMDSPKAVTGRPRSSSIGARVNRNTVIFPDGSMLPTERPQPSRSDSDPHTAPVIVAGKTVKHRKSGFLKMFNQRDRSKDGFGSFVPVTPPPPVPSLTAAIGDASCFPPSQSAQSQQSTDSSGSAPRAPRRVPVPPLSSGSSNIPPFSSPKRSIPPPLSVVVTSPGPSDFRRQPLRTDNPVASSTDLPVPLGQSSLSPSPFTLNTPQSAPPGTTTFASLRLRPVSTLFSAHFAGHLIDIDDERKDTDATGQRQRGRMPSSPTGDFADTPSTSTSTASLATPISFSASNSGSIVVPPTNHGGGGEDQSAVIQTLQEQIVSARKAWQRQIWELEGQVRDLQMEVDELRIVNAAGCEVCGGTGRRQAINGGEDEDGRKASVLNRPRARTGVGSRFAAGR